MNIETYRGLLRINKHALDEALMVQPDIQERISSRIAVLERNAALASDTRKTIEAQFIAKFRGEGATVPMADSLMRVKTERITLLAEEHQADQELAEWKGLYEAWKQRGYSLKELVSLYVAQYFAVDQNTQVNRRDRPDYTAARRAEREQDAPRGRTRV